MLRNLFSRIKEDLKEDFKQDPAKKIRTVQKINAARPKDIAKEKVGRPFPGGKRPLFWASLTSVIRKMSITALPAAVDVGTSSIKLLQLGRGPGDEITIIALDKEKYSQPVPPDPVPSQREALKRIIKRNRIGPKVIVSLA
ncbi:MAG TPA: hypothetical protein VJA17_04380, partial [Candidatus Omnitrophota bacterium]|nr:hypothetical protein [Candidatus Omnitrophota bacterium]